MRMRREQVCSLITVAMTMAFFIALLWGYGQYQQNRHAMTLLENEYQRAYYNYLAEMRDMTLSAGKAHSATALQQAVLLSRLQTLAEAAADHMSSLPLQQSQYQRSVAYLNQVGGCAGSLAQDLARGETLSTQQRQSLGDIYNQLGDMYQQMSDMEQQVAAGSIAFAAAQGGNWWQAARNALAGSRATQGAAAAEAENTADGYFSRANALLDSLEPLNYSGKYSAHLSNMPALGLYGQKQISAEEAQAAAKAFLALNGQEGAQLLSQEEIAVSKAIPLYGLHFGNADGQDIYITVSRMGGKIISYAHEREISSAQLPAEAVIADAQALLLEAGYANLQLVSRQRLGETLLLQYVPLQQGALCYPDTLTLKVALDNGDILAVNAQPYWLNNCERTLAEGGHSLDDALTSLGVEAQISGAALAYISDGAGREVLCHEIRQNVNGEEYLTYIGVENLLEEQVLRGYTAEDGSFYAH